ncbi:Ig-like domain-containing protein [Eubacterium sp. An3]|uniref:Ig-like domain-containing protein n=1 Tax=Eubacterium sp. An3 TaxID=1965628 RepID=UPI000B38FD39|nr:Ig-like domain-containing protein [Eubacterium sp. An3]OUO29730.1 hypothetical protein B5F87_04300 [Eubacterium sp. An3]
MAVQSVKAKINGQTVNLTYNDGTGFWEATTTAPTSSSYNQPGHYYGVEITATDDSGNDTTINASMGDFQEECQLVVKEKVVPVITINSPTSGAHITNNKPAIQFSITDDDSGVDPDTITVKIDNGSAVSTGITKTPSGKGYTCSYTPESALGDGSHTIYINASDHDGNAATQKSVQFTVDTVAPTLNLTSPVDNLKTNEDTVTVSGTTNDATSSPVTVTINGDPVTVQSNGSFSKAVTLTEGENTITVIATDSAGKSTTIVRHVTKDTGAPVFVSVEIVDNPVGAGDTFVIRVKVTD